MAINSIEYIYKIIDQYTPALSNINNSIAKNEARIEKLNAKMNKLGSLGKEYSMKLTLPIIAGLTASTLAYNKFEAGLTRVGTLLGEPKEFMKHKNQMAELMKDTLKMGITQEDLNEAYFNSMSATGDIAKANLILKEGTKLAIAGQTNLGVVTNGLTSIMNAYGAQVKDVTAIANAFSIADDIGNTTIEQLAENIGQVSPYAKSLGIDFQNLLATMSAMTLGGLNTAEATTALKGAMIVLQNQTKESGALLEKWGVPHTVTQIRAKGLAYTLLKLSEAAKKYPDEVSKAIPNIRAYTGVMTLNEDAIKKVEEAVKKMTTTLANGTGINTKYTMMAETNSERLKRAYGSLKVSFIEFGASYSGEVSKIIEKASKLFNFLANLPIDTKKYLVYAAVITAIIPPMMILTSTVYKLGIALKFLNANPEILVLTAMVVSIIIAINYINKLVNSFNNLENKFAGFRLIIMKIIWDIKHLLDVITLKPLELLLNFAGKLQEIFKPFTYFINLLERLTGIKISQKLKEFKFESLNKENPYTTIINNLQTKQMPNVMQNKVITTDFIRQQPLIYPTMSNPNIFNIQRQKQQANMQGQNVNGSIDINIKADKEMRGQITVSKKKSNLNLGDNIIYGGF